MLNSTSAHKGPFSAMQWLKVELGLSLLIVVYCSYTASESRWISSLVEEKSVAAACSFQEHLVSQLQTNLYSANVQNLR